MRQHARGPSRKRARQVQVNPRRERGMARRRTYPDVSDAPTVNGRIARRWFAGE